MQELDSAQPPSPTGAPPPPVDTSESGPIPYYAVSPNKLITLTICTMNIYAVYWLYRQWTALRWHGDRLREISPFGRAVFGVFFIHELFGFIRSSAQRAGVATAVDLRSQATIWVVSVVLANLLSRAKTSIAVLGIVIGLAAAFPLAAAQREINAYLRKHDDKVDLNAGYSAVNILVIVLGGLFLALGFWGSLFPLPNG